MKRITVVVDVPDTHGVPTALPNGFSTLDGFEFNHSRVIDLQVERVPSTFFITLVDTQQSIDVDTWEELWRRVRSEMIAGHVVRYGEREVTQRADR